MTARRTTAARGVSGSAGRRAAAVALLLLPVAAVGVSVPGAAAYAVERVVTITPTGVVPSQLEVAPGDTVRFVSQDATFAYRARSTGGAWSFDSGPTELLDGDYAVPTPVVQPGTYTFRVAQDAPFHGSVVVPGAPAPSGPPAAAATSPAAAPGTSEGAPPVARAVPGQLPRADTARGLGLPVALATLLVLGTASLLVRLVLTEAGRSSPTRLSSEGEVSHPRGSLRRGGDTGERW